MEKEKIKIVFMGTPDFAVASLKVLIENGYNVVAVVTMPDKPKGKHHSSLQASPVKEYALSQQIPVLQPEKLKDPVFLETLQTFQVDLQIVVAFRMLPETIWRMPPLGTFNLHASLLPQYRGAAPINWAIINGEKKTGVTTFFLDKEIDTGKIIDQIEVPVSETENAETLHDKLKITGATLVQRTVQNIIDDRIKPISQSLFFQSSDELKLAPKIFKETCRINWNQPTEKVYNFIRGLAPYPAAWDEIETPTGKLSLKIFSSEKIIQIHSFPAGTSTSDKKTHIDIATIDGFIRLKEVQLSGKKRMAVEDLLKGNAHLF
jgi:methionyl-tRNA formyltransferase